jgi:hypothetical protein
VLGPILVIVAACTSFEPPAQEPQEEPVPRPVVDIDSVEALGVYGESHPDVFGGMYFDPPGGNTVVMLFTDDLELHRDAVEDIRPRTEVRQVEHTLADLMKLLRSLDLRAMTSEDVQPMSAGIDERENRVHLELKTNDPTLEMSLEVAHGGMLDVTVYPIPGPWENVESADGWHLLATGKAGPMEAYVVRAATDDDAWEELWETLALEGDRPAIDLETEVVVTFAEGIGSGCPELRLDGVGIEGGVVYSRTSDPLAPRGCEADLAGAAIFVVALDRDALPSDTFTLQLRREPNNFSDAVDVALP